MLRTYAKVHVCEEAEITISEYSYGDDGEYVSRRYYVVDNQGDASEVERCPACGKRIYEHELFEHPEELAAYVAERTTRKNFRLPAATVQQLERLAAVYGSETKAIIVAVALLDEQHERRKQQARRGDPEDSEELARLRALAGDAEA